MAKKSKQRMKQSLTIFERIWNASESTPEQKAAAAEHFGDGPGPASEHSDKSERRPRKMKGVGLLIILFVVLLALFIYHRSTKKRSDDLVGQTTKVESTSTANADGLIDTDTSRISERLERNGDCSKQHPRMNEDFANILEEYSTLP